MSVDTTTWNAVFSVINAVQSAILLHAEHPITLHPMEEEIYIRAFRTRKIPLGRREFRQLAEKAVILDYEDGEAYQQQGKPMETVAMIMSGNVDVFSNFDSDTGFAKINVCEAWEWADSPQFLSSINSEEPVPCAVSLIASGPTQLCVWRLDDLRVLCAANPQISVCLLSVIANDCAVKILKTERYLLSNESVQKATQALLKPDDRMRRQNSFTKAPLSARQRMDGGHLSIDLTGIKTPDEATNPPLNGEPGIASPRPLFGHTKSARRLGNPSPALPVSPSPPPATDEKTAQKKKKKKPKADIDTEMDSLPTTTSRVSIIDPKSGKGEAEQPYDDGKNVSKRKQGRPLHVPRTASNETSSGSPVIEDIEEDVKEAPAPAPAPKQASADSTEFSSDSHSSSSSSSSSDSE